MKSNDHSLRPWIVNLELTNTCNLACIFCDHSSFVAKGMACHDMDSTILESALRGLSNAMLHESALQGLGNAMLHELGLVGLGEPTLDRHLAEHLEIIGRFSSCFGRVSINSNLVSLTEPVAKLLLGSCINVYTFSLNASNREAYRKKMGRDCFESAISNLKRFLLLRRADKRQLAISVQLFDSPENSEDELVQRLPELEDARIFTRKIYSKPIIPGDTPLLKVRRPEVPRRYPCWDIYTRIYIDVEGNVYPCTIGNDCYRDGSSLCLGNLQQDSLLGLFNCDRVRQARRNAETGRLAFPECETCNVWAFTPNNFHWDAAANRWTKKEQPVRAYGLKQ